MVMLREFPEKQVHEVWVGNLMTPILKQRCFEGILNPRSKIN